MSTFAMNADRVGETKVTVAEITPKTRWIFVELATQAGLRGVGEASLNSQETAVLDAVGRLAPALLQMANAAPSSLVHPASPTLAEAAAISAIDQALWDIEARRQGVRLADALGTVHRTDIPLYANINRRTLDRSPAGFAASAEDAVAAGHTAVKIAPFDEASVDACTAAAIAPGLQRIAAVRAAIGPDRRLMVDCHWRLNEAAAQRVIAGAAESAVHWVECPLPETADHFAALRRLRALAHRHSMLLAGCELGIGTQGFVPFLEAGAYDVMMPDAKYVGSLDDILRLAALFHRHGVAFSPHNPTGPICHAVSLHLSAVVANLHSLETQFDETPLFDELTASRASTGNVLPLPRSAGIGVTLDPGVLRRCAV